MMEKEKPKDWKSALQRAITNEPDDHYKKRLQNVIEYFKARDPEDDEAIVTMSVAKYKEWTRWNETLTIIRTEIEVLKAENKTLKETTEWKNISKIIIEKNEIEKELAKEKARNTFEILIDHLYRRIKNKFGKKKNRT